MYDPTMSEVPPPRKAPASSAHVAVSLPTEESRTKPTAASSTASEDLLARLALPEDSEVETRPTTSDNRLEQTEQRIMSRLEAIEALIAKHISSEVSTKARMCENLEKYASTVALNNALLTTSIEVMKSIQAEVNRITWQQFEAAVKPSGRETAEPPVCEEERQNQMERQSQSQSQSHSPSQEGQSQLGGGCGWVASKEPIPAQIPGYNATRIEPNEFQAIKDDGNLKHVWLYIDACNEKAHKARVQSLSANDVNIIYSNGGCLFPYMKSCSDWEKFTDFRIKYLVAQHYSHCRPKS